MDLFNLSAPDLAVEIGDSCIKIAETGAGGNNNRIVRLVRKELASKEDAALTEEIKNIFASLKITGRKIRLNIPRHLVTVRFLKLPSVDDEEIRKIIKIESLKHIPYADEEVIAGHRVIEKMEDGYSICLLCIAQAKAVERLLNILNAAHAGEVELVSLGSEALYLWLQTVEPSLKGTSLVANIDLSNVDINVVEDELLVFTRGVMYEAGSPSALENISDQIRVSLVTYQKESNKKIDRIILTGSEPKIAECKAFLAKSFTVGIETISQMRWGSLAEGVEDETGDASFVELLGICARPASQIRVSLVPDSISNAERIKLLRRNIMTGAVLAAILAAIAFGLVIKRLHDKSAYLARVDSHLKAITPQVSKVKKMIEDIKIVSEEINKKPLAVDVVREVYKLTPQGILLTMLDYEKDVSLTVRGSAPALNDVLGYVNALESSLFFESVKVKYATKRVVASKESVDFEISCLITKAK